MGIRGDVQEFIPILYMYCCVCNREPKINLKKKKTKLVKTLVTSLCLNLNSITEIRLKKLIEINYDNNVYFRNN